MPSDIAVGFLGGGAWEADDRAGVQLRSHGLGTS